MPKRCISDTRNRGRELSESSKVVGKKREMPSDYGGDHRIGSVRRDEWDLVFSIRSATSKCN